MFLTNHVILVTGDFNASLCERKGNLQDQMLKTFVINNSLRYRQTETSTFFHPNKKDQAEIDYFFYNRFGSEFIQSIEVETKTALNTSDHIPVCAVLKITTSDTKQVSYSV